MRIGRALLSVTTDYANDGFGDVCLGSVLPRLSELCNSPILDFQEMDGGAFNKVFHIVLSTGSVVLKVSPLYFPMGLAREQWALRQVSAFIRAPKVLCYRDKYNVIFPGHELLLMEYVPGAMLQLSDFESLETHSTIAGWYRDLHTHTLDGFGWLTPSFTGMHEHWSDFLSVIDNVAYAYDSGAISKKDVAWLQKKLSAVSFGGKGALLHGDFKPSNFISGPHGLTILDFQNCMSGDPLYDIGIGLFFIPHIEDFLYCYNAPLKDVCLYALRHAVSVIAHRSAIKDEKGVRQAQVRVGELRARYMDSSR
jgi:aminoglycoside phosphotransferase (APT) family kinase protein